MPSKYSSGKNAISHCDRCGFRFKLKQLKNLIIKTKNVNIKVCPQCWEEDHPQLQLGMYPVNDPQAVREPRPDHTSTDGSRVTQWGWNPVGMNDPYHVEPDLLAATGAVGVVTVTII